jgi:quercetin dioxygenase-like cupin family protein/DNA-binding XRE family transcriptional regulator
MGAGLKEMVMKGSAAQQGGVAVRRAPTRRGQRQAQHGERALPRSEPEARESDRQARHGGRAVERSEAQPSLAERAARPSEPAVPQGKRPAATPSVPLAEQAVKHVGTRLRTIRKSQKITLVELAKSSGVDIATISRIETGKMSGTLECHIRLATALGVKLTDLYAGIEEARVKQAATPTPPTRRRDVYVHQAGKASMTMLTTDVLRKKLMPVLITIEPGGSTLPEEARVGTEQFLYVLEGEVEARVGGQEHVLRRGAGLYLDASIPHRLHNVGRRAAKCLSITTPPAL